MALTERYVTTTGAGLHDGTSEANAFTLAEAIADLNTPRVGYRYNIKQGTYVASGNITLTGDGSSTSPNIWRGYKTTAGDATLGRSSGGAINQSNMPTIAFDAGFRLNANAATQFIIESVIITGNTSNSLLQAGVESTVQNCVVTNNSTSASAGGIEVTSSTTSAVGNDVSLPSGVAGSYGISTVGTCVSNRVKNAGGTGIIVIGIRPVSRNTVFESGTGIAVTNTALNPYIISNTIVNCSGDGIDIVTGTTALVTIVGNHITGCGGYGIDFNTSTCPKVLLNNRFRDNTSGAINGDGDWGLGTNQLNITSDDTDALDFTDQAADDYSLKTGAAGARRGLSYLSNIGAEGTPAGSSGGYIIGS